MKTLLFIKLLILLILISPVLSYKENQIFDYMSEYSKIIEFINKEKYEDAFLKCKEVIKKYPAQYFTYEILISISKKVKKLNETIDYLSNLSKLFPDNSCIYYGMGLAYKEKGDYSTSLKNFKESIERGANFSEVYREISYCYKKTEELDEIVNYLNNVNKNNPQNPFIYFALGCCYINLNEYQIAKNYLMQALSIFKKSNNKKEEGKCLRQLGRIYWFFNDFESAIECFKKAYEISIEFNDLKEQGLLLNSIGVINYYLGNYKKAIDNYLNGLKVSRKILDKENEAECLNNLRYCYSITGDYLKALDYTEEALEIARENQTKDIEIRCLISMGEIYNFLGNEEKSLECYSNALEITKKIGAKEEEQIILNNIGNIYLKQNKYRKALKYFENSINIGLEIQNIRTNSILLYNMGYCFWKLKEFSKALENYKNSLNLAEKVNNNLLKGRNLIGLGEIFLKSENFNKSFDYFKRALEIAREINHPELKWESFLEIAKFFEKKNRLRMARNYYEKAINEIENERAQLLIDEYKYGFLKSKIEVYLSLINLLFKMQSLKLYGNFERESFYIAEKTKARSLLDRLEEFKTNAFEFTPKKLKNELKETQYKKIIYSTPFDSFQLQKELSRNFPKKTLILEYLFCKDKVLLWAISRRHFSMHSIPKKEKLENLVIYYYNLLSQKDSSLKKIELMSKRLFKTLFPLKNILKNYNNLIIIPDGVLHFLPFETLKIKANKYLIETHNISYAPSSTILVSIEKGKKGKREKRNYKLLAMGDPVFPSTLPKTSANELYKPIFGDFKEIPYSGEEISSISNYFPKRLVLILKKDSFKEEVFTKLNLKDFQIIHFATHSLIDEKFPSRSAVIFSPEFESEEDGFLQLREIYNLRLNADLVVLSGCRTNLGKYITGEGLLGLTRGFLYAGSLSVISSIWNIEDNSTSYLMRLFYYYLRKGNNKAKALKRAKLEMINSYQYKHPYNWGGIILIGDFNDKIFKNYMIYILWGGTIVFLFILVFIIYFALLNLIRD